MPDTVITGRLYPAAKDPDFEELHEDYLKLQARLTDALKANDDKQATLDGVLKQLADESSANADLNRKLANASLQLDALQKQLDAVKGTPAPTTPPSGAV